MTDLLKKGRLKREMALPVPASRSLQRAWFCTMLGQYNERPERSPSANLCRPPFDGPKYIPPTAAAPRLNLGNAPARAVPSAVVD